MSTNSGASGTVRVQRVSGLRLGFPSLVLLPVVVALGPYLVQNGGRRKKKEEKKMKALSE